MERLRSADPIERNDEKEPPQLLASRHVIVALADATKEPSEDRLDEVFRLNAPRQFGGTMFLDQGPETMDIADIQLGGGILVAAAEAAQEGMVARRGAESAVNLAWLFLTRHHGGP